MKKVLIANRGEIAVRIIRACHELGLKTVAVYSQADKQAMHVAIADEAICVGSALAKDSYLKIPHILAACEVTGADSLHPGYGFLSENSHFASICESSQINFIGPSSQSIAALGNKANAKALAQLAGVATIPGSAGILLYLEEGLECARTIGFPLVIKAVAGGGGKGIRIVYEAKDFEKMFLAAQSEAQASFNAVSYTHLTLPTNSRV